jgi:hypothetical protein
VKGFSNILLAIAVGFTVCSAAAFSIDEWMTYRGDDSYMLRLRTAYRECLSKIESPAEDVLFPIENYPNGTAKIRLRAKRGQMFPDTGFIWAEDIRVEQFDEEGKLTGSLVAENCVVDRKTKTGWVEGNAKMTYGDSAVSGRGIYFSFTREFIKIFSKSEIKTKSFSTDLGSLKGE